MVDYVKLATTAKRLVEKNGRSVVLTGLEGSSVDTDKPWLGPMDAVGVPLPISGVFVPPNTIRQFGLTALGHGTEYIDLVDFSEQIMITFPGETDLRQYRTLVDNSQDWRIIGIQSLKPGDITLLAFIGVRR